jgi:Ca2+-binding EF-hand superfamily protein
LAFFRVVDLDEDGKISYSELLEAITYKPIFFSRDQEFREEFRRGKLLERDLEKVKDNLN